MSDYQRTTRECTFENLYPGLQDALHTHINQNGMNISGTLGELVCYETSSTRNKKGFFTEKPKVLLTAVLITSGWLVVANWQGNKPSGVISARLSSLKVQDYEASALFKIIQDSGLDITGLQTGSPETGSLFIGLGTEPAAQTFRDSLKLSISKAS